jgi:glyoxylase-like metal-dependent hydrolase (beta-lactamase superfamily II)
MAINSKGDSKMNINPINIRDGIFLFNGKLPRNLLFEPIVSNLYFLDDGEEATVFDPSCGKKIAKRVEGFIQTRGPWNKATLIAGHSHLDHANNFYLSDVIGAPETSIYVHENGFKDGKVMNDPRPFIENGVQESMKYYNYYLSFPFPYNLLMSFFVVLDAFSPALARKIFAVTGCMPWPAPKDGSVKPMALKDADAQIMNIGSLDVHGWKIGRKIILPTPGHSPCSVSLYWPEQKALFISDADWLGNPVFMSASLRDSLASLNKIKELTEAGEVELLLPAHGHVKEGSEQILSHLRLRISLLEAIKDEVLAAYRSCGDEKDVRKLTKVLTQESPVFTILKILNYPRHVFFVHNAVAVCLREEGILKGGL